MKSPKRKFWKKLINIVLLSVSLSACHKQPSLLSKAQKDPVATSQTASLSGSGYVDMQQGKKKQRFLFQVLLDNKARIYFEAKQLGVTGLVFGYQNEQSTVLIPREKRAIHMKSSYPLSTWHYSRISESIFFSALLYDFEKEFERAVWIKKSKGMDFYQTKEGMDFYVDSHSGQIVKITISNHNVIIKYGPWREGTNFPEFIDIFEGQNKIHWVWKQIQRNKEIPDHWYAVQVPESFSVEKKQKKESRRE